MFCVFILYLNVCVSFYFQPIDECVNVACFICSLNVGCHYSAFSLMDSILSLSLTLIVDISGTQVVANIINSVYVIYL